MNTFTKFAIGLSVALIAVVAVVLFGSPEQVIGSLTLFGIVTASKIQEKINAGADRIQAITDLAEEESRELTEDEQKEINAFHGEGDEPGEFGKLQTQLAQAKKIEARQKQIAEQRIGATLDDHIERSEGTGRVVIPAQAKRHGKLTAFGEGDDAERDAYVSGQWILAKLVGDVSAQKWLEEQGITAAMSSNTATLGQELVPEPLEAAIIRIVEMNGIIRQFARPTPMASMTHKIPKRVSGLTVYHPDENASITSSDMNVDQVLLTAKSFATLTKVSNRLDLTSIISVANSLAVEIGLAFAAEEDRLGFLGDGSAGDATITGLEDSLAAGSKVTGAGATLASLTLANFEDTSALLPDFVGADPCWWTNRKVYKGKMVPLMNAAGGTPGSEIASGYDGNFLGDPVKFVAAMPSAPATGKAAAFYGTLAQAVYMGTLQGATIATSNDFYFGDDAQAVRGTEYAGITVENQDGASTAGPMVGLYLA